MSRLFWRCQRPKFDEMPENGPQPVWLTVAWHQICEQIQTPDVPIACGCYLICYHSGASNCRLLHGAAARIALNAQIESTGRAESWRAIVASTFVAALIDRAMVIAQSLGEILNPGPNKTRGVPAGPRKPPLAQFSTCSPSHAAAAAKSWLSQLARLLC